MGEPEGWAAMADAVGELERVYRAVPLLRELTPDELSEVVRRARLFKAAAGTVLLREGEDGRGLFVVVNGMVRVTVAHEDADPTSLALLGRGDTVGEMSLIDGAPHSATARAETECVLFHLRPEDFAALRSAGHPAAFKILRAVAPLLCDRLRRINERIGRIFAEPERSLEEIEQAYLARAERNRLA